MERAGELFTAMDDLPGIAIERLEHGSNVFPVSLEADVDTETLIASLRGQSVFVYADEDDPSRVRLTVNTTILRRSADELLDAFREAVSRGREDA